jgi:hypothetical protein
VRILLSTDQIGNTRQKRNLTANCASLGDAALSTCPKLALPMLPFTAEGTVELRVVENY